MSAVLKLLQNVDPKTRQYIRYYKISEIYECLLSGVSICKPDDAIPWLIEKLELMQDIGLKEIKWDMFIPDEMKPNQRPVDETALSYIFNFLDEMLEPSAEMIEKAYRFYNKYLMKKLFFAWLKTHLLKKYKRQKFLHQFENAAHTYRIKLCKYYFSEWNDWTRFRKDRQAIAQSKLTRVLKIIQYKAIVSQWHIATREARQTREYFERLERGEYLDESEKVLTNGEARDDISALPRAAAIKIFTYLSVVDLYRCAEVCRSWKMLVNSNILWSKIDLYPVREILTDKVIAKIIQKCRPYLLHLNVRGSLNLTRNGILSIVGCRNLQDLNISDCRNLTDDLLNSITTGCHILLYLNISFNEALTDSSLRHLGKNCINLQYLSVAFCVRLTDKGFFYLPNATGLRKLVYADLSGCENVTPAGYQFLANHCRHLDTFVVNDFATLNDRHLKMIAQNCSKLTNVTILDSPFLSDDAFRYLSAAKHLKTLKISGNHTITDTTFKSLTRNCLELNHVYITDCPRLTDSTLKMLSGLKNLIVLNIADCVRISDIGIKLLAEGTCALKLREINLTNCLRLGNPSLIALARKCKNITYLSLCFCDHIEEDGLDFISQMENLISIDLSGCKVGDHSLKSIGAGGKLRYASFSGCKDITDLGLQKFCNQCPGLDSLDLSYCPQLTDNSIKSLAFCCKLIRHLNLCACSLLTDMSLQYLSGVCIYLQTLDVSYCQSISDKGMKYLRKGCKHLRRLVIVNCRYITRDLIEKMQEKIPEIEHHVVSGKTHREDIMENNLKKR